MPTCNAPEDSLPSSTGRRTALHAIAALGAGWVAAIAQPEAIEAKKKRKAKVGRPGPAGAHGPQGPAGAAGSALTTRLEISALSPGLPVELESFVVATADCGGEGRVLSCGYQMSSSSAKMTNVIVRNVEPNSARSTCNVFMQRTAGPGSVAGAEIQAVAICLV